MPKKLILDTTDETWNKVIKYKVDHSCRTLNDAVNQLLEKALKEDD